MNVKTVSSCVRAIDSLGGAASSGRQECDLNSQMSVSFVLTNAVIVAATVSMLGLQVLEFSEATVQFNFGEVVRVFAGR